MKGTVLIISILIFFAGSLYGQDKFLRTGEYWKEIGNVWGDNKVIEREIKLAYVVGLYEGHVFRMGTKEQEYTLPDHKMGYVCCEALDQFYSDDRNVNIPVVFALTIIDMELRGEKKETIEKNIRELSKKFGNARRREIEMGVKPEQWT